MKNLIYFFAICYLMAQAAMAQQKCGSFDLLMNRGNDHYKAKPARYQDAINAYMAAMLDCPDKAKQAQDKIALVFKEIEGLKNMAEKAKKETEKALVEVEKQRQLTLQNEMKAIVAQKNAEKALIFADSSKKVAEDNNELFSSYASISFNFFANKQLNQEFLSFITSLGREKEIDSILTSLIKKNDFMDIEHWNKMLPYMSLKQKAELMLILGKGQASIKDVKIKRDKIPLENTAKIQELYFITNQDSFLLAQKFMNRPVLQLIANSLFEKQLYFEALKVYDKNLNLLDEIDKESLSKLKVIYFILGNYKNAYYYAYRETDLETNNYNNWRNLSFYALFVGKPQEAIQAAKKTLQLNPEAVSVETNLALGYLFDNQLEEAKKIYLKWKGKNFPDDKRLCDEIFLKSITELEKAEISHPDFEKVKKLFGK